MTDLLGKFCDSIPIYRVKYQSVMAKECGYTLFCVIFVQIDLGKVFLAKY